MASELHQKVAMEVYFLTEVLIDYSFFAFSWKAPREVDSDYREKLRRTYTKELQLLLYSLLPCFYHII